MNNNQVMTRTLLSCALAALIATGANAAEPKDVVSSDSGGNTAMGDSALYDLGTPSCGGYNPTACFNTAGGAGSLYANSSGAFNTAYGFQSMNNNQTGAYNAAGGYRALLKNQSGYNNTAFGASALSASVSDSGNTAVGYESLTATNGSELNTAVGEFALTSNTAGSFNTGIGAGALQSSASGGFNTALGEAALGYLQTGSRNTALGADAGENINAGSDNIDINNYGSTDDSGVIRIGTAGEQTKTYIAGIESSKITGNAVYVTSSGRLGVLASSERYKDRIASMGGRTDKLRRLRPVTFHLKTDPGGQVQYGLIAEEVVKVFPELVIRDDTGRIQGVRYDELAPMLLNEVQKQQHRIASQEERMAAQDAKLARLEEMNVAMQAALADLISKDQRVAKR